MDGRKNGRKEVRKKIQPLSTINSDLPTFGVLYILSAFPFSQAPTSLPPKGSSTYYHWASAPITSLKHHHWPLSKSKEDFSLLSRLISLLHLVLLDIPSTELTLPLAPPTSQIFEKYLSVFFSWSFLYWPFKWCSSGFHPGKILG